jgi:hypothetical protein
LGAQDCGGDARGWVMLGSLRERGAWATVHWLGRSFFERRLS